MVRSLKYSGMVADAVAQAKALNPNNPRPYLISANNVYYTPKMFGVGLRSPSRSTKRAKPNSRLSSRLRPWCPTGASSSY